MDDKIGIAGQLYYNLNVELKSSSLGFTKRVFETSSSGSTFWNIGFVGDFWDYNNCNNIWVSCSACYWPPPEISWIYLSLGLDLNWDCKHMRYPFLELSSLGCNPQLNNRPFQIWGAFLPKLLHRIPAFLSCLWLLVWFFHGGLGECPQQMSTERIFKSKLL